MNDGVLVVIRSSTEFVLSVWHTNPLENKRIIYFRYFPHDMQYHLGWMFAQQSMYIDPAPCVKNITHWSNGNVKNKTETENRWNGNRKENDDKVRCKNNISNAMRSYVFVYTKCLVLQLALK